MGGRGLLGEEQILGEGVGIAFKDVSEEFDYGRPKWLSFPRWMFWG